MDAIPDPKAPQNLAKSKKAFKGKPVPKIQNVPQENSQQIDSKDNITPLDTKRSVDFDIFKSVHLKLAITNFEDFTGVDFIELISDPEEEEQ